jgi:hypothetical protein
VQAIGAYLISMLTAIEVGLSIIAAGALSIGLFAVASWAWSRAEQSGKSPTNTALVR